MVNIILFIIFLIIILFPHILPKSVYGVDYYVDTNNSRIQREKVSIIHFFFHQIVVLFQELIIGIAVSLSLRGAVTILIFLVVGGDLFFKNGLSPQGLAISIIGVIALYLDQLVQNASELDFFKGIFHFKSK